MKNRKWVHLGLVALTAAGCAPQQELDAAKGKVTELEGQLQELSSDYANLEMETEVLQQSYDELESRNSETARDLREKNDLVTKLVCEDQIDDMKYTSISDASTIMAAWWAKQQGVVATHGAYRDQIWSNADTRIHGVRFTSSNDNQQYVEHFIVYFSEFGMSPGVFWIGGQCWLDVP